MAHPAPHTHPSQRHRLGAQIEMLRLKLKEYPLIKSQLEPGYKRFFATLLSYSAEFQDGMGAFLPNIRTFLAYDPSISSRSQPALSPFHLSLCFSRGSQLPA